MEHEVAHAFHFADLAGKVELTGNLDTTELCLFVCRWKSLNGVQTMIDVMLIP
jgi:hypothetical protein